MNSYIIASKNLERAREEADKFIKQFKVSKFDIEFLDFEGSIGIEDVRNIQKKIFLKPLKGERKALIISISKGISDEAQNSMLKLLEEPPPSSLIFLLSQTVHIFLPTILSRAKIIELNQEKREVSDDGLRKILSMEGIGDSLYIAQNVGKDKDEAINFLEDAILSAREKMFENLEDRKEALKLRNLIHKLELAHYDLKTTNVNPRLALENLFLNI